MTELKFTGTYLPGLLALMLAGNVTLEPQSLVAQTLVSPAFETDGKETDDKETEGKPQQKDSSATEILRSPSRQQEPPDPLLRYRLWPAAEKRRNASVDAIISRAIILTIQASHSESSKLWCWTQQPIAKQFQEWQTMPLAELPIARVKKHLSQYGFALDELKRGESLMRTDYELHLQDLTTPELYGTLLPEVQESRQLSSSASSAGKSCCSRAPLGRHD